MEGDTNSLDEMEDDMDFRAIERLCAEQPRESICHPPSYRETLNSPSGSVYSEFSTFSTDDMGVDEIRNYSDIDYVIDDAAFLEALYDYIEADEELMGKDLQVKTKKSRVSRDAIDYWATTWGQMLQDPNSRLDHTRAGKLWIRRFRLPMDVFDMIVEKCNTGNIFRVQDQSKVKVPTEFKVMMALRILGRGNCADDIAEMSNGCESTVQYVFRMFCINFVEEFFHEFVYIPTGEMLQLTMDAYAAVGVPGGMGSMDATHVGWEKCPVYLTHLCKGKEKFPTVAFNCVVDHFRFIQYVSDAYFGATNDIQICQDDEYPVNLCSGDYEHIEYDLYRANGQLQKCKGAFLICDGGMPKNACFIHPQKHRAQRHEVIFAEWLESIRKDVECTFGILKQRFRYLKNKIQHHDIKIIEAAFKMCCILHNMILVYKGKYIPVFYLPYIHTKSFPSNVDQGDLYLIGTKILTGKLWTRTEKTTSKQMMMNLLHVKVLD